MGTGPEVDIALDPLEGTTLTAKDMPNALAVIAMGPRGSMLHAPDTYMDKLAIGPGFRRGVVTMDMSPAERVNARASAKGCSTQDITVCVLERPRHEEMIAEIRTTGAAIRLITDGDVAGVVHCAEPSTGIDMYMGSGGAPEGVLAAAALKCMGGQMYGRLTFRNDDERARAKKAGITNLDRVYTRDDMVTGDVIFAATGVTDPATAGSAAPATGAKAHPARWSRASVSSTKTSMNSEPEVEKKGTSASPARALASSVLPVPGGPTSKTPCGTSAPTR